MIISSSCSCKNKKIMTKNLRTCTKLLNKKTRTKTRRTCNIGGFDFLPDDLAYEILSRLSIEDIFRLSFASKRCRQLCISTSFLTLDDTTCRSNASKRAQLMKYLDRFMCLRRGFDTKCLRICWSLQGKPDGEERRFLSWLHHAMKCNVKELDLDIVILRRESDFTLPFSLFRCESLKSLVAKFHKGIGVLKIPYPNTSFCHLKSLDLYSVHIDESFGKWISCYFKSLEKLCLTDFEGTKRIDITSSSLKLLDISSNGELIHLHVSAEALKMMFLCWEFDSLANRELKLSTPKLETLIWLGNISKLQFTGNFIHLEEVSLFLNPDFDVSSTQNLVHLLHAVHNVTALDLNDKTLQALKQACLTSLRPILFTSLSQLFIRITTISDNIVLAMASIFERSPNLHFLEIMRETSCKCQTNAIAVEEDDTNIGSLELQGRLSMQNLNFVTINLISQGKRELELIMYLLKYASNLQKMTLYYDHLLLSNVRRQINQYEKAPNAQVNFYRSK